MSRLKKERKAAKLTQKELAHFAQVAQGTISKIENRSLLRPGFEVLHRLAWALKKCGRKVDAVDLSPQRQPVLIKGVLAQRRRSA